MAGRGHIRMIEIAAALAAEKLRIPHEHRVLMTAEQVMSLVHPDHDPVPHAHGGPDLHFNLTIRPIMEHRRKTAEKDIPQIAKTRRIQRARAQHAAVMAAKNGDPGQIAAALEPLADPKRARPKAQIKGRPLPGTKASGVRKRMNGNVERW